MAISLRPIPAGIPLTYDDIAAAVKIKTTPKGLIFPPDICLSINRTILPVEIRQFLTTPCIPVFPHSLRTTNHELRTMNFL